MEKICYIYRSKKRNEHSIENVFLTVENEIKKRYHVKEEFLPEERYFSIVSFLKNIRKIYSLKADVYHVTGEIYFCAIFLPRKKTIVTIHDYVSLEQLKGVKNLINYYLMFYLPIWHSRYVTCISKKVYDETVQRFPWCKKKLALIENPLSPMFSHIPKSKENDIFVFLFIGTLPHKNLKRLAEALEGISCKLDIIGILSDEQIATLNKHKIVFENSFHISNEEIKEHYIKCDAVCFPSTYEGFGMPIIEGQAIGRPVITSNISPMKDVAGGAAHLVNPFDVYSIRDGIIEIIENESYRNRLVDLGLKNVNKYMACNISKRYADLYNIILGKK